MPLESLVAAGFFENLAGSSAALFPWVVIFDHHIPSRLRAAARTFLDVTSGPFCLAPSKPDEQLYAPTTSKGSRGKGNG
jgi:hypothetical protein